MRYEAVLDFGLKMSCFVKIFLQVLPLCSMFIIKIFETYAWPMKDVEPSNIAELSLRSALSFPSLFLDVLGPTSLSRHKLFICLSF